MNDARLELHNKLKDLMGSSSVYFQPPPTFKIQYPCIIYSVFGFKGVFANNKNYIIDTEYDVIYVTKNPDDEMTHKILAEFRKCSFVNYYVSDNLHHYKFRIYYK